MPCTYRMLITLEEKMYFKSVFCDLLETVKSEISVFNHRFAKDDNDKVHTMLYY